MKFGESDERGVVIGTLKIILGIKNPRTASFRSVLLRAIERNEKNHEAIA
jgi:hypothetical protein